jgi:hypothetical protein
VVWAYPAAALALVAVVIPLLLHLFTRRRARPIQFPTLRFIQASRLASLKRRALDDVLLLAIRIAIVAAAAAAATGPLLITPARRRAWDARTIQRTIGDVRELRGAVAWLRDQPPGRREIVVRSAFPLGSITDADVALVPAAIGLRFERSSELPASRVAAAPPALTSSADRSHRVDAIEREVTLTRGGTSVREIRRSASAMPVEVIAPAGEQEAADAIVETILREHAPAAVAGRLARIELARRAIEKATIRDPWMGAAAAHIIRDAKSHDPMKDVGIGSVDGRLVIATSAHTGDPFVPVLIRAVFDALAPPFPTTLEILAIPDRQLAAWSRPPAAAPPPAPESVGAGDRRWFWLAALGLLVVESIVRRARSDAGDVTKAIEGSRVA